MKSLLLRWQPIIAALIGFVLSVAWEADALSTVTEYPLTWFFGTAAVALLVWGMIDALNERQPGRAANASDSSGGGSDRVSELEDEVRRLDDQVQELRREEL